MKKYIIFHINVEFTIEHEPVIGASDLLPWFNDFIDDVKSIADNAGYAVPKMEPVVSRMNGGVSKYYTFAINTEEATIKAIVGLRFSNHPSKLSKSEQIAKMPSNDSAENHEFIDVVQPDVAYVHITVDGTVVRDESVALQIIEQKLIAFRDRS